MRANSSERGFTMAELVMVIVIMGVLAVVALPRIQASMGFDDEAWRQDVATALRHAHHTAVAARRLVCANVATGSVTLSIAGANPASSCSASIPGYNGNAAFASSSKAPATTSATLYFQPSGRVTSDGAGSTAADFTITISSQPSTTVSVTGETGHVE
ncbi:type II secretion system protein [Pelomonas sp. SE-A7]|uniref:type II secretion system protein n=1 Tax=Pelomonas sp. SE-A7 TaxID=3054953 RepID=UPI00259C7694|nr:type II secretion system protein [Pelomonas sp. SE-A7]MDM4767789.1 type II secretion system protein [Pelomonas sp. SE-A7]